MVRPTVCDQVRQAMRDCLNAGVEIFTLGQYLRPSKRHLKVKRMLPPAEYDAYRDEGMAMGFRSAGEADTQVAAALSTSRATFLRCTPQVRGERAAGALLVQGGRGLPRGLPQAARRAEGGAARGDLGARLSAERRGVPALS